MWFMGLDNEGKPNGWSNEPSEGYIEVTQEVRDIHEVNPDYIWGGITLVAPPVPEPHIPTEQEIISMLQSAVQSHLDEGARLRMYVGILSACSYVNSTDPAFQAEGLAYCDWRDGCWRKCYEVLNACQNALRVIPTSEELINELPILILS